MNETAEHVEAGGHFVSYHDETLLWKGSPSQWLNFGRYMMWLAVASLGVGLLVYWYVLGGQFQFPQFPELTILVLPVGAVVIGWSFIMILFNWLRLSCHRITITQNKITVSTGLTVFFRSERYCELSDVIDIEAPAPGLMGIVGLGSLLLRTNDTDQPEIYIHAIHNRTELRDALMPLVRRLRVERNANVLLRRAET
ncbi:MAG: PH domain-containing protein [Gammaproteobacteria bacterium]